MFVAHVTQEYEGGDNWGDDVWKLNAQTKEDAIVELRQCIFGKGFPDDEDFKFNGFWEDSRLKSAVLYEVVSAENMPVKQWYDEAVHILNEIEKGLVREAECKEYERLKVKFEKGE